MAITEDVIVSEGTFAFTYTAGGTISAGDAVYVDSDGKVQITATEYSGGKYPFAGVAVYDAVLDEDIAIVGPGNIVRAQSSGGSTAGDVIAPCPRGCWKTIGVATTDTGYGICLETATDGQYKKILI